MILALGLLALSACEKEENFSSPEVQLTAEKLILCPGDEVIIKISSPDTIVDLSLVSLQLLNPSVGELNNFTYSAPADLSEDEQILIQATSQHPGKTKKAEYTSRVMPQGLPGRVAIFAAML